MSCNTPYKIAEPVDAVFEVDRVEIIDSRAESAKLGLSDRRNAIYRLADAETIPKRIDALRSTIARRQPASGGRLKVDILEYDVVIFAGKSESQMTSTYATGVVGGLLSGALQGVTALPLNLDIVLVAIVAEVNGRPVTVWAYREFEGLRDMPFARRAVADANRDAVENFLSKAGI